MYDLSPLAVKLLYWSFGRAEWRQDRQTLLGGQFVTTIAEMQEAMSHYAGWKKVKPTADQIRSAYGALCGDRRHPPRITARRTTRGMVITVLNYAEIQNQLNYASRTESVAADVLHPAPVPYDSKTLNIKQIKKEPALSELEKIKTALWENFKDYYPGDGNRSKVRSKFSKTITSRSKAIQFVEAAHAYINEVEIKRATTFPTLSFLNIGTFVNQWPHYVPDDWEERGAQRKAAEAEAEQKALDREKQDAQRAIRDAEYNTRRATNPISPPPDAESVDAPPMTGEERQQQFNKILQRVRGSNMQSEEIAA